MEDRDRERESEGERDDVFEKPNHQVKIVQVKSLFLNGVNIIPAIPSVLPPPDQTLLALYVRLWQHKHVVVML